MMDEAKLKSIELDLQDKYGDWPSRSDLQAIIDALRRERERADRAEAELTLSKVFNLRKAETIKRLEAVCLAAEVADKVLAGLEQANEDIIDEDNPPLLPTHWSRDIAAARATLRRSLECRKGSGVT